MLDFPLRQGAPLPMFEGMISAVPGLPLEIASGILLAYVIIVMCRLGLRFWNDGEGNVAIGVWLFFGGFGLAFILAGLGVLPW